MRFKWDDNSSCREGYKSWYLRDIDRLVAPIIALLFIEGQQARAWFWKVSMFDDLTYAPEGLTLEELQAWVETLWRMKYG